MPVGSCPSIQLGLALLWAPPAGSPTQPWLRKESIWLRQTSKQNTDRTSRCVHALRPNLWGRRRHHFPASQLQKALLLCARPEESRAGGQLLAQGLGWAGRAGVARRCPQEECPSAWRVGRSGAGGLGQERESEASLRPEATSQAPRELACQDRGQAIQREAWGSEVWPLRFSSQHNPRVALRTDWESKASLSSALGVIKNHTGS